MKKLILFLLLLIVLPSVLAVPPQTSVTTLNPELTIIYPKNGHFLLGETIDLHFHAYNSTGHLVTNDTTDCTLHLYNETGNHIYEGLMNWDSNDVDFYYELAPAKARTRGEYGFLVHCNNSYEAGFASASFNLERSAPVNSDVLGFQLGISLFAIALIYILIKLALEMADKHHALKLFFIWISFILMLPATNLMYQMAQAVAVSGNVVSMVETVYYIAWVIFLVGTAYFGIFVFRTTLEYLAESTKRPYKREK